jgi:hypothetical protein
MSSKFNSSYMAMSSLTYIPGFSVENFTEKPEYMLNYSFPCSCSNNLSSFRFIIKQQWAIEEISVFSNSSHLEWRAELSDTFLKGTHVSFCHHLASVVVRPSYTFTFESSPLKPLNQIKPNLAGMVLGWISINRLKEKFHRKTRNIC